jgi:hypothetical protein
LLEVNGDDDNPGEPCKDKCLAEVQPKTLVATVSLQRDADISVSVDDNFVVRSRLIIPSGALRAVEPSTKQVQVRLEPVAESRIRNAISTVTYSRRDDYGNSMPFQEVLLSSAFECFLPDSVQETFGVNLTYIANIDTTRNLKIEPVIDASDVQEDTIQDVCISTVEIDVENDYAVWRCKDRAVLSLGSTNEVSGAVASCGSPEEGAIYGFTHTPERLTVVSSLPGKGVPFVLVILIILAVVATVALVIYVCKRLHRYRKKYHDERVAVDQMQREVDEMNMFGGAAGTKDDQVAMTSNPLVMQVADVERQIKEKDQNIEQARAEQAEAESNARQDHIGNLKEDKNDLQAELERLKAQLASQQSVRPAAVAQPVPAANTGPTDAARADLTSAPARGRKKKRAL